MDSLTPVNILTGVYMGDSQIAGCVPQVNNITGALHGHHFHSTLMDLQTPVYSSTPNEPRTAVYFFWLFLFLFHLPIDFECRFT